MGQRTEIFDLGKLGLSSGEGRRLELEVPVERASTSAGSATSFRARLVAAVLDVEPHHRRLRAAAALRARSSRALHALPRARRDTAVEVDAREIDQPGGGEDLRSPYLDEDELDLGAWARDALALALPTQIVCREDCLGLCAVCGENLNDAARPRARARARSALGGAARAEARLMA